MVVPDGPGMRWQSHGLTDRGLRRRRNEDALLVAPESRIYAVADGMGGHAAGNVASRIAIQTLAAAFPRAPTARIQAEELSQRLLEAFEAANAAILAHAEREQACRGMGTTLTALMPLADLPQCVIAHVGDSRAFRLRRGELLQITRDHTWVQQQVDAGMLTPVEARHHGLSSVLSRVMGTAAVGPADSFVLNVEPGDLYLLCSDGLTTMVDDADLLALLAAPLPLDELAASLVAAANLRGGSDNITVVVLKTESP
jgi:PPM family protein phosphatase